MASEKSEQFQTFVKEFGTYVKDLGAEAAMLEGKIENFQRRKELAQQDFEQEVKKHDLILSKDRESTDTRLTEADKILNQAYQIYADAEKQRMEAGSLLSQTKEEDPHSRVKTLKDKVGDIRKKVTA